MDDTLLHTLHAQWLARKDEAARRCDGRRLVNLADAYRRCDMFKGRETLSELARLYKSPRGVEFCLRHHFPALAELRRFKPDRPERFGIYIDAGRITVDEPRDTVLLIGDTEAEVNCAELRNYRVACLHGARATVNANGRAVVRCEAEEGAAIIRNAYGDAMIL